MAAQLLDAVPVSRSSLVAKFPRVMITLGWRRAIWRSR